MFSRRVTFYTFATILISVLVMHVLSTLKRGGDRVPAEPARKQFPMVSIADRLPQGKPVTPTQPVNVQSKEFWERCDFTMQHWYYRRAQLLRNLHEDTTLAFLTSPGNGAMRSYYSPRNIFLDGVDRNQEQFGNPADSDLFSSDSFSTIPPNEQHYDQHYMALFDFLYPQGFGYAKDRDHVAGFFSHGFRGFSSRVLGSHKAKNPWQVDHVALVGILTQPETIVYLTDKMPSMEQIKKGTTRKLDAFEEKGLKELAKGEDLFIIEKDNTLRMLGALRATKSCLQCHDTAKEYDLMGAFSYTIRRNMAFNPADKPKDEGEFGAAGL